MRKVYFINFLILSCLVNEIYSITMDQFMKSLDMMRNGCTVKFPKVPVEDLDKFRSGVLPDNITKDFKCYTKCVAQLGGVLTKKGEISVQKSLAQMLIIIPKEMHETTGAAINACSEVQKPIKESCDKTFAFTKCLLEFSPSTFIFP